MLGLMIDCVREGAERWSLEEASLLDVLLAAKALAVAAAQPACAGVGFRAVLARPEGEPYHWGALLGLQSVLVAEGKHDQALRLLDSALAAGVGAVNNLYLLDALAGARMSEQADRVTALVRRYVGDDYSGLTNAEIGSLVGSWHALSNDTGRVRSIESALARLANGSTDRRTLMFSRAVAARLALGRGDTAAAIGNLRALYPTAPRDSLEWDISEPLASERLLLGQLLLVRGEYEEAHRVASAFDHPGPIVYIAYVPPSLVIRHKAALALGKVSRAREHRERLVRLGRTDLLASRM
jgi:hypothetical protein